MLLWPSIDDLVSFCLSRLLNSIALIHRPDLLHCPYEPNRDASQTIMIDSVAVLRRLLAQDVGVTGVKDGHGGAAEELTAGGAELNLQRGKTEKVSSKMLPSRENMSLLRWVEEASQRCPMTANCQPPPKQDCVCRIVLLETHVGAAVVVDGSLGQHGVVLQLRLAQRRGVAGDENQLGLARAERCEHEC